MDQLYKQIIKERMEAYFKNVVSSANSEEKQELADTKDQINSLKIERTQLKDDRQTARLHLVALAKKENNQQLNDDEQIAMNYIKSAYPVFFQSSGSEPDPEVETSPEYKERQCVANVRESLNQAISLKKVEIKNANDEFNTALKAIASRAGIPIPATVNDLPSTSEYSNTSTSMSESPNPVNQSTGDAIAPVAPSTLNQSASDITAPVASSTLNKSTSDITAPVASSTLNKSTSDYIDSLPKEYNPFDDLGDD